ncbi:hypothetical protein SDC9_146939 [bioreactor metagenome]|uniref:Uncharacterized protein n=1 Tax=bioreactor metagenome TaxID=1076179 RepID=A0A645EEA1_9ZZZZ
MNRRSHGQRRDIGWAVRSTLHLVEIRQVEDASHMRDTPRMHDTGADIVDLLPDDQVLAVPYRVEDFADRQWRRRVLTHQVECLLVLGRGDVLQPEQPQRLQFLAQPRGFDRRQPVMSIVQQRQLGPDMVADLGEHDRRMPQIGLRVPDFDDRLRSPGCRFVGVAMALHPVYRIQPGDA